MTPRGVVLRNHPPFVVATRLGIHRKVDMEIAIIELLLAGNVGNTVHKVVTPGEAAVLRSLHGSDAVVSAKVIPGARDHATELDRLRREYGKDVIDKAFGGAVPRLPATFSEVGVQVEFAAPEAKRKKVD